MHPRRIWRPSALIMSLAAVVGACSSPPKPPTTDGMPRRPANSGDAVALQVCKSDLEKQHQAEIDAKRQSDMSAAQLALLRARQQLEASRSSPSSRSAPAANAVYTLYFDFGSARVDVPTDAESALVAAARVAPLVMLRGRTDGATDAPAESHIARQRAEAVRDYLVDAGVTASRIRTTFQPSGDTTADNASPSGRRLNRRVEIEIYRSVPTPLLTPSPVERSPAESTSATPSSQP